MHVRFSLLQFGGHHAAIDRTRRRFPISHWRRQLPARRVIPLLLWELGRRRTTAVSLGYLSRRLEAAADACLSPPRRRLVQIKCRSAKKLLSGVSAVGALCCCTCTVLLASDHRLVRLFSIRSLDSEFEMFCYTWLSLQCENVIYCYKIINIKLASVSLCCNQKLKNSVPKFNPQKQAVTYMPDSGQS